MIYYKAVTKTLRSLGLRNNPTILRYPIRRWIRSPLIKKGVSDGGGIWVARNLVFARKIRKYMEDKYGKKVRIFQCLIGNVLYQNLYRVKTDRVKLLKELKKT